MLCVKFVLKANLTSTTGERRITGKRVLSNKSGFNLTRKARRFTGQKKKSKKIHRAKKERTKQTEPATAATVLICASKHNCT